LNQLLVPGPFSDSFHVVFLVWGCEFELLGEREFPDEIIITAIIPTTLSVH